MNTPEVTKHSLGMGYVVGTGVVLSIALTAHAITAIGTGISVILIVLTGLVPALSLTAANYWLPKSGLEGNQIWTVAEWGGFGVALLTLCNVGILLTDIPTETIVPGLLASSVAIGGFVGILVGALFELRRSERRLTQSNDVLNRVLRHDMRNDLNVVLGHLTELDRTASDEAQTHVDDLRQTVDEMITTTEKARQIDVALGADRRAKEPVDIVPYIEDRITAVQRAYPDASVDVDMPDETLVYADWLLGSVLDNIIENAVIHADDAPDLEITVTENGGMTRIRITDSCPTIPDDELDVFSTGGETPLQHSRGVGLWLVTWVIESYGGDVVFETTDDGGNTVVLELRTAGWLDEWQQRLFIP